MFPESSLLITFEVYNELLRAKETGYDFVDDVLKQEFKVVHLYPDMIKEYEQKKEGLKNLHALVESAVKGFLTEEGIKAFDKLHATVVAGKYKQPWFTV